MKFIIRYCAAVAIFTPIAVAAGTTVIQDRTKDEIAWQIPKIELGLRLAKIFTVTTCEWVSGMTCHIHYNGKTPLPSEVFFTEYDASGKVVGPPTRLIYPDLKSGHTGIATFFLRSRDGRPARIVLSGKWDGPWKNPY